MTISPKTGAWTPEYILRLLNKAGQSQAVARDLGVSDFTLWRYMKEHRIRRVNCYVIDATSRESATNGKAGT